MKLFTLLDTQYNSYLNKVKSYLSKSLSDFDSLYGHTRDVEGYARAIEELDVDISIIINKLEKKLYLILVMI